jgi:uncharacterized protein YndB with AHSA1/START domain
MTKHELKVETTDRELILTRQFDAPRDLVFKAFSSCEHLQNWWGPRTWPVVECRMDFRVGGMWHYCMRGPDEGDESWGRADYEDILKPERIIYIDAFSDANGGINEQMPRARVTYEFAEVESRTLLTAKTEYASADDLQKVLAMGMVEGITETLDRLVEHLERVLANEG